MEKEFVPYEIALELKELGFNEHSLKCWFPNPNNKRKNYIRINSDTLLPNQFKTVEQLMNEGVFTNTIYAPLYQQSFRFFREKYQKNIVIFSDGFQWTFDLRWVDEDTLDKYPTIQFPRREIGREMFDTYEEAELECLKKLIEIVKQK